MFLMETLLLLLVILSFTTLSVNATATGYAVGVAEGVYFIRGTFVDVPTSQIVLRSI